MEPFLERKPECKSRQLICEKNGEVVSYCEYFYELSAWRFAISICISSLYMKVEEAEEVLKMIFRYVYQNCKLKVGMIKFYTLNTEDNKFMKIAP